jgi:hypothetical protein
MSSEASMAPADWPKIVTFPGSPRNRAMLSRTQWRAAICPGWSSCPRSDASIRGSAPDGRDEDPEAVQEDHQDDVVTDQGGPLVERISAAPRRPRWRRHSGVQTSKYRQSSRPAAVNASFHPSNGCPQGGADTRASPRPGSGWLGLAPGQRADRWLGDGYALEDGPTARHQASLNRAPGHGYRGVASGRARGLGRREGHDGPERRGRAGNLFHGCLEVARS